MAKCGGRAPRGTAAAWITLHYLTLRIPVVAKHFGESTAPAPGTVYHLNFSLLLQAGIEVIVV